MMRYVLVTIIFIMNLELIKSDEEKTFGMFGKLKSGFQMAGKILGLDQSRGVAQLVSDAFNKRATKKKGDDADAGQNIFSGFLRVLGFDAKRIGAIAINGIIFLAQLISTSLARPTPSHTIEARKLKKGSPLDWMMTNIESQNLLSHIKDDYLSQNVIEYVKERTLDEDTDCIQLLICKTAPLVRGMQRTISNPKNATVRGIKALYSFLPSLSEFAENGDKCEYRHPFCLINY